MTKKVLLVALAAGLAGGVLGAYLFAPKGEAAAHNESAYTRVMRTGVLKCGYFDWPPYVTRDPNTGKLSGIWYDYMEKLGGMLGWKVEWQSVGLGDARTALDNGHIDSYCGGLWITAERLKVLAFTRPISYQPMLVYVRGDEKRFAGDWKNLDNPAVKFSTIDGEGGGSLLKQYFSHAQVASLPNMSSKAEMLGQVVYGKADALLTNPGTMPEFNKNNPGKLKPLSLQPVSVFAEALAVGLNEPQLQEVLDNATASLIDSGETDQIIGRYESAPGEYWRASVGYNIPGGR